MSPRRTGKTARRSKMLQKIKNIIYGKPAFNLEIKATYTSAINNDKIISYFEDKVIPTGKKRGYIGNFIVTDKKFLLKGKDDSLENKSVDMDLNELSNSEGIMELKIVDFIPVTDDHGFLNPSYKPGQKPKVVGRCAPPHIHFNGNVCRIEKNLLGKYLN